MEPVLAIAIGILVACAVFLLLARDLVRVLLGIAIFSNAVNLVIFTAGGLTRNAPPLVPDGLKEPAGPVANPLPQALILTAIVIGFSLLAFALVLTYRAYASMGTVDVDAMREAEPPYADQSPPSGAAGQERARGADVRAEQREAAQ
ncbi:multisubunit sodium/proton antiporter, MrpC subunit [Limimonas halophila]|uniref:Multisubunit sodium/proton antiporter, MrpC subunit n=1 Tax=Limimonas halophila TaxID=1082479 RepID=A0A1G7NSU8_9PROT|nr:multisubunit sodium/proton antiporter, MrpC subunit [Limimonas halophila]